MKQISKWLAASLLLAASASQGIAQNLNKHFYRAENVSIDYLKPTDEYALGGHTYPYDIDGMLNISPATGLPFRRIQLEEIDKNLDHQWFKTYVTDAEQNAIWDGSCSNLAVSFQLGYAKQTKDEGYILCGRVVQNPEISGCAGDYYDNIFLLRTDKDGDVVWYSRYDRLGMLNSVLEANDGSFIACGYAEDKEGTTNGLILSVDANGAFQWARYAYTPFYDHSYIVPSYYKQIKPFGDVYALVGVANRKEQIWGATLVTLIDAAGNYYQDAIVDNQMFDRTLIGNSLYDANDGELTITGMAGVVHDRLAQVSILKLEPYSMSVNFLKAYHWYKDDDMSFGNAILADKEKDRICVTGRDSKNDAGLYLQTDISGNLQRYTLFKNSYAMLGMSITHNTSLNVPVFSGLHDESPEPTFVVRNTQDKDCAEELDVKIEDLEYKIHESKHREVEIKRIKDKAYAYKLEQKERIVCGSIDAKNGVTTSVTNVAAATGNLALSPNPATHSITLQHANLAGSTVKVYDVMGRLVIETKATAATMLKLDVSPLATGTYTVQLIANDGAMQYGRFVKE